MKILILTQWLENYRELADLTDANKLSYCAYWAKKGVMYDFLAYKGHYDESLPLGSQKIKLIKQFLPAYDIIFWQDTDSMIMNFTKRIEDFLDDTHSFYFSSDINGCNGGSFIIKNDVNGNRLLDVLVQNIPAYADNAMQESAMLQNMRNEWQDVLRIMPQTGECGINAYFDDLYYWIYGKDVFESLRANGNRSDFESGDFLVHWPGCSLGHRIELATSDRVLKAIIYE
jgi:hypothetical protein